MARQKREVAARVPVTRKTDMPADDTAVAIAAMSQKDRDRILERIVKRKSE